VRKSFVLATMLVSALSAGHSLCDNANAREKLISEEAVRIASARLYSDILIRACLNGMRYPRSQIESGFKRHLSEMKLQFADQGYVILPDSVAPTSSQNPSGLDVAAKLAPGVRKFGCFRRYWLDD
jgi:hypothetical protein